MKIRSRQGRVNRQLHIMCCCLPAKAVHGPGREDWGIFGISTPVALLIASLLSCLHEGEQILLLPLSPACGTSSLSSFPCSLSFLLLDSSVSILIPCLLMIQISMKARIMKTALYQRRMKGVLVVLLTNYIDSLSMGLKKKRSESRCFRHHMQAE